MNNTKQYSLRSILMVFRKKNYVIVGLLGILTLSIVFFINGCRKSGSNIRHVILISIDTCRADHLSCYGFERPTTPNIDALAAEGVLFRNAITPVPLTLPAHSSMLTGTIPAYHGIHFNDERPLDESNTTLAEVMKKHGYATGAVVAAHVLDSKLGIAQGFDYYNDEYEEPNRLDFSRGRIAEESSDVACEWFTEHKDEPFFFFLHYYDPHYPCEPPEPYASKFSDDLYAGEIAYTDEHIGRVMAKLKELGIYDSALIILTGDHGEMLGEHREIGHGYFIYEGAIKVPLIIKRPGSKEHIEVDGPVGLVDIVPTICGMMGIKAPSPVHGEDLSDYWEKPDKKRTRYIYIQSMTPIKSDAASLLGVVSENYKYIQTTRPELYDTVADPCEMNNLVNKEPKRAHLLRENLKLILKKQVRSDKETGVATVDEETRKKIESLGYVGGSADASFDFEQGKKDPKDTIGFYLLQKEYEACLVRNQLKKAKEVCREMIKSQPDFIGNYCLIGELSYKLGELDEALDYFTTVFALAKPNQEERPAQEMMFTAHEKTAVIYLKKGNFARAVEHWSKALEINPDNLQVHYNLAMALLSQNDYETAVGHFEKAIEMDPNRPEFHNGIAKALVFLRRPQEVELHLRKSLELEPKQPDALNSLGGALAVQNKTKEAIGYWQKALVFIPDSYEIHHNLAVAFESLGNVNKAIEHWKKVSQLKPDDIESHYKLARLYYQAGDTAEAAAHWTEALRLKPDWPEVLNDLAWVKATTDVEVIADANEAVRLSEKACELTEYNNAAYLDTLSVCYAGVGRTAEAIEIGRKALQLARDSELQQLAEEIQSHLAELEKAIQKPD